jgi:hypothetical protein
MLRPPLPTTKYIWYSFVLYEESTKGPCWAWKDNVSANLKENVYYINVYMDVTQIQMFSL